MIISLMFCEGEISLERQGWLPFGLYRFRYNLSYKRRCIQYMYMILTFQISQCRAGNSKKRERRVHRDNGNKYDPATSPCSLALILEISK